MNSEKSVNEGRRVSLKYAIPRPQPKEIAEQCHALGFPVIIESDKCYPGDYETRGRVKVKIAFNNEDGSRAFTNENIKNKNTLLKIIGPRLQELDRSAILAKKDELTPAEKKRLAKLQQKDTKKKGKNKASTTRTFGGGKKKKGGKRKR